MANNKLRDLIEELKYASDRYYNYGDSPLSDKEFDAKLEELRALEETTGLVYSDSPTQTVGSTILDSIKKIELTTPMLSLAKVHSIDEIRSWGGPKDIVGSIKFDGLSVRLCYERGHLIWASTRGNGYVGSDITAHVKRFANVPINIQYIHKCIIDGEAIITYDNFNSLNTDNQYKNPRNLAAGTLGLLDMEEVARRNLEFYAWDFIEGSNKIHYSERLDELQHYLGFDVSPYVISSGKGVDDLDLEMILGNAKNMNIPCDGVVWRFNDIAYGESLGATSHHKENGRAWKAQDECEWTKLIDIQWSPGRTGKFTPVAIFEPVELEGSIIERANLHNITILQNTLGTKPYKGQKILIARKNMVIPQIVCAEKNYK